MILKSEFKLDNILIFKLKIINLQYLDIVKLNIIDLISLWIKNIGKYHLFDSDLNTCL